MSPKQKIYVGLDKDQVFCEEWFIGSNDGSFSGLYQAYVTEADGVFPYDMNFPPVPNQYSPITHKSVYVIPVEGWKNGGMPVKITDLMPTLLDKPKLKIETNG